MKTNNIFKIFLVTALLFMGVDSVNATVVVLSEGRASEKIFNASEFAGFTTTKLRIYQEETSNIQILTADKSKFYFSSDGSNFYVYGGAEYFNSTDGYYEFAITSDMSDDFQTDGLYISSAYWRGGFTKIEIEGQAAPSDVAYGITCADDIAHGNVSANVLEAKRDDIVTITATADVGFKLKHFLINGTVVSPSSAGVKQSDGTTVYTTTFSMPNKAVTVSAEFIDENIIWQGSQGTVEISGSYFVGVSADATLRVWTGKDIFWIGTTDNTVLFQSLNSGGYINSNDFATYYRDNGGYFEFTLSEEILAAFSESTGLKLLSSYGNGQITQVMLIPGSSSPDIPTHTLTLIIDGQTQTKTVAEGTDLTNVLPTPTKEGYTFTGWDGIPDGGNMPTSDLTVTAQFSINSYKLTYKVDGEVFGDVETIEYGASITPRTAPTKPGFSFSGWNGLPETMPAHDVEVTGEFTGIKYKVEIASTTYGVITTDKEAYEKGETVTVTIKDNTGYEMESISTDPTNLGLQRVDDGVFSFVMPDADVMVTVRFKAKEYTLTFMLNNEVYEVGEIPQVYQVRYGTSITLPADPAQEEGYTFSGWSGIPADGKMPAGDLIVYGHFNAILSVGSTGYATYCPKKPIIFQGNEDIKAYIAKEKSDSEVTLIQVIGAVAAGTGLVLVGDADAEMEFEVTNEGTDYSNENLMIGVTGASANIHASNLYVLVQKEDGVKFADTAANAATVPVGKAYLQAPVNSSRILTICFSDESTGLETVRALTNRKVEVYNLSGQRIANPRKGLYIVNGKKAFIK